MRILERIVRAQLLVAALALSASCADGDADARSDTDAATVDSEALDATNATDARASVDVGSDGGESTDACVDCDASPSTRDAGIDSDPIVTIHSPTTEGRFDTWRTSVSVSGAVTATSSVAVDCHVATSTCGTSSSGGSWSFSDIQLEEGSNRIEIRARDAKNRVAAARLVVVRERRVATAKRAFSPIAIDGELREAAWELGHSVDRIITGASDNVVSFGVLWGADYFYVGLEVFDDRLFNDSTASHWDDSIEAYVDPDASRGVTSDGRYDAFDRQFILGWNDSELAILDGYDRLVELPLALRYASKTMPGAIGYTVELAIPWSSLGVFPLAGNIVGFDVQANDDDYGAALQESFGWNGDDGRNHRRPEGFGTVVLSSDLAAPAD